MHGTVLEIYNDKPVDSLIYLQGEKGAALQSERQPGDGLIVASGPNPDNETYVVTLRPGAGQWTELGVDVVEDESLPGNRISRGADRFLLTGVEAVLREPGRPDRSLTFSTALGDKTTNNGMPATAAIDNDPETGWGGGLGESLASGEYSWPADGTSAKRVRNTDKSKDEGTASYSGLSPDMRAGLVEAPEKRRPAQKNAIREYFEWTSSATAPLRAELDRLEGQRAIVDSQVARVVTTVAVTPQETRILPRGNWMDDSGEIVEPAIPEFLGKVDTGNRRANRLDLANWIVSDNNPLTARVIVDRLWREFFGTGLSKSVDDLGSQGEWPTHPELIDWLAAEFQHPEWQPESTHDWDLKHVIRTIVLSQTYRQSRPRIPKTGYLPGSRVFAWMRKMSATLRWGFRDFCRIASVAPA